MGQRGGVAVVDQTRRRARGQQASLRADLDEMAAIITKLRQVGPDLITRAAIVTFDGFGPGRSSEDVGRSSTRPDPTAAAASTLADLRDNPGRVDPMAHHVQVMIDQVATAVQATRRAESASLAATRVPAREESGERRVAVCENCNRFEIFAVAEKAGRCGPCYMYRYRHDRDAPEHVVRARPEVSGRRERRHIDPTQPGAHNDPTDTP